MAKTHVYQKISPVVADEKLVAQLREIHHCDWPAGLERFKAFSLADGPGTIYLAVAWSPADRALYVQKRLRGEDVPASRMPIKFEVDEDWISRVKPVAESILPEYMKKPLNEVDPSLLKGLDQRAMLINALVMVDTVGAGREADFIIDDNIFFDADYRNSRIREMQSTLHKRSAFRSKIHLLLTKFMWFGGGRRSMLARTPEQGGPGEKRLTPACKPGRLSHKEMLNRARATMNGKKTFRRGKRTTQKTIDNMTDSLTKEWAREKVSLAKTHQRMIEEHYPDVPIEETPSYGQLKYQFNDIVVANKLREIRYGSKAMTQYFGPRTGSSSDITQGVLEILDADGFRPKLPVGALVAGKLQPVEIWIIFAVSRLSGAILGYEIALDRESGKAYQRCLAACLLPKDDRVEALGLQPLKGLLYGNIDGIFTDNGPGKSKAVRKTIDRSLGGIMFNPPGERGDLKPFVERLNETMITIMAEEIAAAYTRRMDRLERIKRRIRRMKKPIPLDNFERFLLKAISHLNLTSNKRKLRTTEMYKAGVGITPAAIHVYQQAQRRGEAARVRSAAEVYDTFLPWDAANCSKGLVLYKQATYGSEELKELARLHSLAPSNDKSFKVKVKRIARFSDTLLCRSEDGKVFDITMTDADKRRFGRVSWKAMELALLDESVQEANLKKPRAKSANQLKSTRQEELDAIEKGRGNAFAGAVGRTKTKARQNGAALRESDFAQAHRAAYGLPTSSSAPAPESDPINVWETEQAKVDDPLAQAALKAEEEFRRTA
ncbi:hypothetical protein [Paraburkholderia caribensis]|uniref:hypothetical protein n=1 Tax=Paraburkholderia caribensis TaxID=75105 RepID=UPI001CB44919|nr:hypothetical protein [Paraburkholderia caribensis]CAG9269500.1 conserved hypothetical protein [Paraburkholderia caribensis]